MWKHVLAAVVGATIGVAIGYTIHKPNEDAVEARVADEVAAFKRRYKELHEEASSAPTDGEPESKEVKDVDKENEELSKSYETTSDEHDIAIIGSGGGLYQISEDKFIDEPQPETQTFLYYTIDGIVASTDEEVVPNPEGLIGDWFSNLEPDESCYVRNEDVGVDYEIQAVPYSYKEYVLGE